MHNLVTVVSQHGYLAVALALLAEALGLPIPAALALLAAGAGVASDRLNGLLVSVVAVSAMFLGDCVLYVLGRRTGWKLLGFLCKVSVNPETCILRSAEFFHHRGKLTLVLAKFIPGVNTMAPPLAGSMKMPYSRFAVLDVSGVCLYVAAYGTLGFAFRDFVAAIVNSFQTAGRVVEIALGLAVLAYIVHRIWVFSTQRRYRVVPRIAVEELARRLQSEPSKLLIVDVRSHGYYDAEANRILGSIRLEPNNLSEEIKGLPRDRDLYVYCT